MGTLVEQSNEADNYRTEGPGSVAGLLLLKAATMCRVSYFHKITAHCDNMGIIKHGSAPDVIPPEKQVQVDLIFLIKKLIKELPCEVEYEHVFGHPDKVLTWRQLIPVQKLKVL